MMQGGRILWGALGPPRPSLCGHRIVWSETRGSKSACFSCETQRADQALHLVLTRRNSHLSPLGKQKWLNWNF